MKKLLAPLSLFVSGLCVGWLIGLSISPVLQTVLTSVLALVTGAVSILAGLSVADGDSGDKPRRRRVKVTPVPVAMLVLGIAIGAPFGIHARTNLWFGPNAKAASELTGIPEKEINKRAYEQLYPPTTGADEASTGETGGTVNPKGEAGEGPKGNENASVAKQQANENSSVAAGEEGQKKRPSAEPQKKSDIPRPAPAARQPSPAAIAGLFNEELPKNECDVLLSLRGPQLRREMEQYNSKSKAIAASVSDNEKLLSMVREVICRNPK
jgi:hypothetical protein